MPMLTSGPSRFLGGSRVPPDPVPVAGAELAVDGGFDSAAGWLNSGFTIENGQLTCTSGTPYRVIGGTVVGEWLIGQIVRVSGANVYITHRSINSVYSLIVTGRCTGPDQNVYFVTGGAYPVVLDSYSLKKLTLATLISTKRYSSANCDITANVTRIAGTQAGFAMRVDDPANPANFLIAYETGAGRIKVDKCLSGVYSNVIDAPITYGAGVGLRGVCNGSAVTAYYNGALVGTAQVTDAAIVGNQHHGLFSTHASNTFANYRNRVGEWVLYQDAPVPVVGANANNDPGFDNPGAWGKELGSNVAGGVAEWSGTTATAAIYRGSVLTVGLWYRAQWNIVTRTTGAFGVSLGSGAVLGAASTTGAQMFVARCVGHGNLAIYGLASGGNPVGTCDNLYAYPITLSTLISVRPYASADIDLYAGLNRLAGTQMGFALRVDDPDNPQNFIIVYETGTGRVRADKIVSGVYTNVLDAAITYGVGVGLRAVANGTGVSVWYNGVQVGSTVTVADASIRYNTHHGLFSTYEGNTFSDYVANIGEPITLPEWATAGGAPTPIACYQPMRSASLDRSYINLANPGSYDATPGVAPTFDPATGWTFNGITQYLISAVSPMPTWSMVVRFSNGTAAPAGTEGLIGSSVSGAIKRWYIARRTTDVLMGAGSTGAGGSAVTSGVLALSGLSGYLDGSQILTVTGGWDDPPSILSPYIGALNVSGSMQLPYACKIQAVAIYNVTLTAVQVAAVSAAMAAL